MHRLVPLLSNRTSSGRVLPAAIALLSIAWPHRSAYHRLQDRAGSGPGIHWDNSADVYIVLDVCLQHRSCLLANVIHVHGPSGRPVRLDCRAGFHDVEPGTGVSVQKVYDGTGMHMPATDLEPARLVHALSLS